MCLLSFKCCKMFYILVWHQTGTTEWINVRWIMMSKAVRYMLHDETRLGEGAAGAERWAESPTTRTLNPWEGWQRQRRTPPVSFLGPLPDVLWEDSGPTGVQGEPTPAVRTPPTSLWSMGRSDGTKAWGWGSRQRGPRREVPGNFNRRALTPRLTSMVWVGPQPEDAPVSLCVAEGSVQGSEGLRGWEYQEGS